MSSVYKTPLISWTDQVSVVLHVVLPSFSLMLAENQDSSDCALEILAPSTPMLQSCQQQYPMSALSSAMQQMTSCYLPALNVHKTSKQFIEFWQPRKAELHINTSNHTYTLHKSLKMIYSIHDESFYND